MKGRFDMQESIIKMLYTEFVTSSEPSRRNYLLNDRIDFTIKELNKMMNKKQKKKFERLCDDYEKINSEDTERAFVDGFSFAIQLMSEAYAHK